MPQFPHQAEGSALQALCPELLVAHVHGAGGGTHRVPRGTFADCEVSALPPQLLVGSATARLEAGGEWWGAEPEPCFGDREETGASPQWMGQLVQLVCGQAGGRSGILQLKGFFWPEIANIIQT